ncbi:MAG: hypothetical protein HFJ01_07180 [Lachnospiraceae bacterium]|nr:hypothetical protein [Lachnospiraceae bacterium]
MKKKTVKNRYGVQVGDIFRRHCCHEDVRYYFFYQVIALRGETQVVVRQIGGKVIAFDRFYERVVPVQNAWASDEILVRKVHAVEKVPDAEPKTFEDNICSIMIKVSCNGWSGYAHLDKQPEKEMYLEWCNGPCLSYLFEKYNPELAKQLNLYNGSGVFAADRPFKSCDDDCRAVIRYPDGRQQETTLSVLLHYAEYVEEKRDRNG